MQYDDVTTNQLWRTAAILKIVFGYSQRFIVRLTWNLVRRSRITLRHRSPDQNTKFQKLKMADCCHFENSLLLYLSQVSSDFNDI